MSRVGLGGHLGRVEHGGGGLSALDVEEVVAADQLDGEGAVVAGLAVPVVVLGVVEEVLHGEAVGGEEGLLVGGEVGGLVLVAGAVELHGMVVEGTEFVGEVVVFHERVVATKGAAGAKANQSMVTTKHTKYTK